MFRQLSLWWPCPLPGGWRCVHLCVHTVCTRWPSSRPAWLLLSPGLSFLNPQLVFSLNSLSSTFIPWKCSPHPLVQAQGALAREKVPGLEQFCACPSVVQACGQPLSPGRQGGTRKSRDPSKGRPPTSFCQLAGRGQKGEGGQSQWLSTSCPVRAGGGGGASTCQPEACGGGRWEEKVQGAGQELSLRWS